MIEQGGCRANRNGKGLEGQIRQTLLHHGYVELDDDKKRVLIVEDTLPMTDSKKWFVSQASIEKNLYGSRFRSDFFIYNSEKYPAGMHIESKWQGSQGSVDEKYVFTALSLKAISVPSLLVLDGGGARQGAIKWLRSQATGKKGFRFMTFIEFMRWAQKNL